MITKPRTDARRPKNPTDQIDLAPAPTCWKAAAEYIQTASPEVVAATWRALAVELMIESKHDPESVGWSVKHFAAYMNAVHYRIVPGARPKPKHPKRR